AARHAFGQIATAHVDLANVLLRIRAADFLFDALGGRLADQTALRATNVRDDRLIEAVAADAHRVGIHDAIQRDDRDLGGAAADVDDHRADCFVHGKSGADRRGHRFFDETYVTRTGRQRRLANRATLDFRRLARHAHEYARARPDPRVLVHLVDEVLQHLL